MKFKDLKAIGNWVVIKAEKVKDEEKVTKTGIILPGEKSNAGTSVTTANGKEKSRLFVFDVGPDVKYDIKKGDEVVVDNYDIQTFGDDEDIYCVVNADKVKCVVKV